MGPLRSTTSCSLQQAAGECTKCLPHTGFWDVEVEVGNEMEGQNGMTQPWVCAPFSFFLFNLYNETHLDPLSFSSGFLKVPGADLQNICTLQTPEDSSKILELATGKNLVIVGASFIGTRLEWVSNHQ